MKYNKDTIIALDKSIEKWEGNLLYSQVNKPNKLNINSCPLCKIFNNDECEYCTSIEGDKCPIYYYTGDYSCSRTSYHDFAMQ